MKDILLKTVETQTDPCLIVSHNGYGAVLAKWHYFSGEEGETTPRLTTETEGVVYLDQEGLRAAIACLQEFVEDGQ